MTAPTHEPGELIRSYRMDAPNLPETAKVARDMVAALLRATEHPALVDVGRLLVSEVVTNVHLHARVPQLTLEATVRSDRVRV
ncbi:MAG: ATP-binding protein, partial [Streptomyces sp.]